MAPPNYETALNVLKDENFEKLVFLYIDKDLIRNSHGNSNNTEGNNKNKIDDLYYEYLARVFQSVTTRGYYAIEIIRNNYKDYYKLLEKIKDREFTKDAFFEKVTGYLDNNIYTFFTPTITIDTNNKVYNIQNKNNEKYGFVHNGNSDVNFINQYVAEGVGDKNARIVEVAGKKFDAKSINANDYRPDNLPNRLENRYGFASFLIDDPEIKLGSRNNLELAVFFNCMNNIELSKSFPYFNATFILPNIAKIDKLNVIKTASPTQFLYGSLKDDSTTKLFKKFEGGKISVAGSKTGRNNNSSGVIETNMSLFTMPQSLVNMDEEVGHYQNSSDEIKSLRLTSVNNPSMPFMTIKNVSLNTAPTQGLMSFKTGKISITLHDRTRMVDIAPFVKPDLLGIYGAEIALEYGWNHIDSGLKNKKKSPLNPVGDFINASKLIEKYMITNSSVSIDNTGIVNIDLSIAMLGSAIFKSTELYRKTGEVVKSTPLLRYLGRINYIKKQLGLSQNKNNPEDTNDDVFLTAYEKLTKRKPEVFYDEYKESQIKSLEALIESLKKNNSNDLFIKDNVFKKKITYRPIKTRRKSNKKTNKKQEPKSKGRVIAKKAISNKKKVIIKKSSSVVNIDKSTFDKQIQTLYASYSNALKSAIELKEYLTKSAAESKTYIDDLLGDIKKDFFYLKSLDKIKYGSNPDKEGVFNDDNEKKGFITFGHLLNRLVTTHLLLGGNDSFDEIQTIFYTANENAAGMRNTNIASFLINKELLKQLLADLIEKNKVVTLESFVSQVVIHFFLKKDSPSYLLHDIYQPRSSYTDDVIVKREQPISQQERLYNISEGKDLNDRVNSNNIKLDDLKFVPVSVSLNLECLTNEGDQKSSIFRISVYDRNDNPFEQITTLFDGKTKNLTEAVKNILKDDNNKDKDKKNKKNKAIINDLVNNGVLEQKNGIYSLNLSNKDNPNLLTKDLFKKLYPSLTFGNQSTALISGNVSTVNENKLSTIYITRADRQNNEERNKLVSTDLPVNVLPSQASVEIIGCPWVNFSQFIFLDFETGTSMDNRYTVTGINHQLSPGKFTTQLTLSYGDNFGQFENYANILGSVAETPESEEQQQQVQNEESEEEEIKLKPNLTLSNKNYNKVFIDLNKKFKPLYADLSGAFFNYEQPENYVSIFDKMVFNTERVDFNTYIIHTESSDDKSGYKFKSFSKKSKDILTNIVRGKTNILKGLEFPHDFVNNPKEIDQNFKTKNIVVEYSEKIDKKEVTKKINFNFEVSFYYEFDIKIDSNLYTSKVYIDNINQVYEIKKINFLNGENNVEETLEINKNKFETVKDNLKFTIKDNSEINIEHRDNDVVLASSNSNVISSGKIEDIIGEFLNKAFLDPINNSIQTQLGLT